MDQQILKQIANYGSVNKEDVDLLLQLAKEQQHGVSSNSSVSKSSWVNESQGSHNQAKKDQPNLPQAEKVTRMHGQTPFMLPPHLLSHFNLPNGFPAAANPNGHSKETSESHDYRCLFCSSSFPSQNDLSLHIVKQHIPTNSEQEKKRSSVDEDKHHGDAQSMFHSKSWSDSSSHSSDVDSTPGNFPIPIPNFSLFNGSATTSDSSDKESRSSGGLPALNMNFQLNPSLFSLPAFGLLNPLLNYQNLINAKSVPGALPGLNISPYGYLPYVGIPSTPAATLPSIPGRFPYFPGLSLNLPNSSNQVPATSTNEKSVKNSNSSGRNELKQPVSDVMNNSSPPTSHSESLQRNLSVPMVPYSNEFRVPHPYTRIRKPSHNTHNHEEKPENSMDSAYDQQIRGSQATSKKRPSVNDKSSSNHLNVKSIEQHISKLISNNEKLLTNPELERVKPRRVFRRNSLDPATLSSYSSGMTKYNSRDAVYFRDAASKPRRMLSESDNSYRQPNSDSKSLEAPESNNTSSMLLAEYNKMIQLTRAPYALTDERRYLGTALATKANEQFSKTSESRYESSKIRGPESFTLKRNYPSNYSHSNSHSSSKKSRRSSFFECNDCGVRYRKEENYKIHKKIYCKFKNANTMLNANDTFRRHSDLPEPPTCTSGKTLSLERSSHRMLPHFQLTRPLTSRGPAMPAAMEHRPTFPLKSTRPDLCRTKSAEASLETALVQERNWKRSDHAFSSSSFPVTQSQQHCSVSAPATSHLTTSNSDHGRTCFVSGITSTMPANKLPPNKRHLMRHNFEQESDLAPSPQSDPNLIDKPMVVVSSNADGKAPDTNDIHCESKYDESLIPRSNYKLLVHQISLRNLQDIGMMGDLSANLFKKSVWSWEQMQNLRHDKTADLPCDNSPQTLLQGMPTSLRKFSIPSRLLSARNPVACSTVSTNYNGFDRNNSANLNSAAAQNNDILNSSASSTNCNPDVEKIYHQRFSQELARDLKMDEPRAETESVSNDFKTRSDVSEAVAPQSEENAKLLKTGEAIRRQKSVVLYPHADPVLESHTYASFCCMVSPQPACIEASTTSESNKSQISMYSEWAASEPFLIPEDLSIGDILNGWCRCRALSERGVVTCMCKKSELLLTDNKDYEKSNETSAKNAAKDENEKKSICHDVSKPSKAADSTKFKSKFVYTSCHHKQSANGFPYAMLPDFDKAHSSPPLPAIEDVQMSDDPDDVNDEVAPLPVEDDGTSSAPRDSDAEDTSRDFSGKVKRLRSRKDRSSTSPREKRKAAEGASVSPTTLMAIHHEGVCCDVIEHKSSGCALCSMKAGKAELLPERSDSVGSKSPSPPKLKFATVSSSNQPAVTEAVLDRTRGTSGNTQHWVSDASQMNAESTKPTSSSPVFGETVPDDPTQQPPLSKSDNSAGSLETSKNGVPDRNGAVVSPSLAEVVSEVMRSAAMQSKMHSKRRQLLSGSRALQLRENDEESPALKRRNVRCSSQPTRLEENGDASTSSPSAEFSSCEDKRADACQVSSTTTALDLCADKNGIKLNPTLNDASLSEANVHHEADSSANDDDDTGVRYDESKGDGPSRSPGSNIAARPFRCSECQIAFRIGGHLAKHLRSKGHFVAVQKKTLNRLKLNQIQKLYGIPGLLDVDQPVTEQPAVDHHQPSRKGNGSVSDPELSEIIPGSDVLARAQVRALLEGNDEYACVPHLPEHSRFSEEPHDGLSAQNDPRPYKCIACKVAFRFQGHLDRHFRSNSHLIAVGHYEQTTDGLSDTTSVDEQPCPASVTQLTHTASSTHQPLVTLSMSNRAVTDLPEPRCTSVVDEPCTAVAVEPPRSTRVVGQLVGEIKKETSITTSSGQLFEIKKSTDGVKEDGEIRQTIPNGFLSNRTISSSSSTSDGSDRHSVETGRSSNFSTTSQLNEDSETHQALLRQEQIASKLPLSCRVTCT